MVTESDARQLGDALERALRDIPEGELGMRYAAMQLIDAIEAAVEPQPIAHVEEPQAIREERAMKAMLSRSLTLSLWERAPVPQEQYLDRLCRNYVASIRDLVTFIRERGCFFIN
jgi:hypothetical protein